MYEFSFLFRIDSDKRESGISNDSILNSRNMFGTIRVASVECSSCTDIYYQVENICWATLCTRMMNPSSSSSTPPQTHKRSRPVLFSQRVPTDFIHHDDRERQGGGGQLEARAIHDDVACVSVCINIHRRLFLLVVPPPPLSSSISRDPPPLLSAVKMNDDDGFSFSLLRPTNSSPIRSTPHTFSPPLQLFSQ
jgi:hypothetical protein